MLDYFPNADHAGIYAAQAGGHFEQAGLDVEIRQPPDPAAPIKQVAAGRVDLAISYEPEVLRARDQGLPRGQRRRRSSRSRSPRSSRCPRRRSASPPTSRARRSAPPGSTTSPPTCARSSLEAGVRPETVKERNVGFGLTPALLTGKVDAVARRLLELRGHRAAPEGQAAAHHPHGRGGRADLRRARAGGQRGRARARRGQDPRLHRRALARHARPAREPRRGDRRAARGQPRPRPRAPARGREGHAAALLPAAREALRLAGPGAVGRLRGLDEGQRPARAARPTRAPPTTTSCCRARVCRSPLADFAAQYGFHIDDRRPVARLPDCAPGPSGRRSTRSPPGAARSDSGGAGERVPKTPCSGLETSPRGCTRSTSRRARSSQVMTITSSPGRRP